MKHDTPRLRKIDKACVAPNSNLNEDSVIILETELHWGLLESAWGDQGTWEHELQQTPQCQETAGKIYSPVGAYGSSFEMVPCPTPALVLSPQLQRLFSLSVNGLGDHSSSRPRERL